MQILDKWMEDIPQQFLSKHNIEVLIKAFARQLQEVQQVFDDLKTMLSLDTATVENLDHVGTIVSLSRKDAHTILRKAKDTEITDDVYRNVLRYMTLKNSCECTYEDIMESMRLIWNETDISYVEKPERPATIFIMLRNADIDGMDPVLGRVLAIKPSGVSMIYAIRYFCDVNIFEKLTFPVLGNKVNICNINEKIVLGLVLPYEVLVIVENVNVPVVISRFTEYIQEQMIFSPMIVGLDVQTNEKSGAFHTDVLCSVSIIEKTEESMRNSFEMKLLENWIFPIVVVSVGTNTNEIVKTDAMSVKCSIPVEEKTEEVITSSFGIQLSETYMLPVTTESVIVSTEEKTTINYMSFQCSNCVGENMEYVITINKDEWYLDGSFYLDGTKLLDSALTTEVL